MKAPGDDSLQSPFHIQLYSEQLWKKQNVVMDAKTSFF